MKNILILLLILPITQAANIEIYSEYTTHPSFLCPDDAERCELYELVDSMNRNITPPRLVLQCMPGVCKYINDVGGRFGFRVLPGDIVFGASLFKGYKINKDPEIITTVYTTEIIETTFLPTTTLSCHHKSFVGCLTSPNCKWIGDMVTGRCYEKYGEETTTTATTTAVDTTTTVLQKCLVRGEFCQSDNECCSKVCQRKCLNGSILGFCLFSSFVSSCQ